MPIVADIPTAEPGLGFPEYVDALSDAVRGGQPAQFTVGLYGAWGSGKSSLLKAIEKSLGEPDGNVLPVLFDAWRYERSEHIIVPLLCRISDAAQQAGNKALAQHLGRAIKALIFSLNFSVAGVGIDGRAVRENWQEFEMTHLDDAFSKPFEELRRLPETLSGRRVAVLVDDLDRCSPEKVVSLLEAINLVMDIEGFIFVLALDYDVLVRAVAARYPHVSGHEFIEKMVQLPFRVPPLAMAEEQLLDELIPNWGKREREFPDGFARSIVDIAELGLRSNPRQIKRLINSFLVLERIVERRKLDIDRDLMAAMIGLQLRWPDRYQGLQDDILAADSEPFSSLMQSEDEMLIRYAERFFAGNPPNHTLREILQLTAVVVSKGDTEADPLSTSESLTESERLELGRENLCAGLSELGFERSERSERLWYKPRVQNFRVAVMDTHFRFEEKLGSGSTARWRRIESLRYSDAELGLEMLQGRGL
jgi:hypothetical protein